jgi:hypothetical protein
MNWSNSVNHILLPDFYILIFAHVIPIHVDSWAFFEEILITAKPKIIVFVQFKIFGLNSPNVVPQVIVNCVFEVVKVGEVLLRMCLNISLD